MEREKLAAFLEKVQEGDDVPGVLARVREERTVASRKRLRTLVQRDDSPASLAALTEALTLSRDREEVNFGTLEELAEAMYFLAWLL